MNKQPCPDCRALVVPGGHVCPARLVRDALAAKDRPAVLKR
jgi:hypothetical protein